MLFCWLHTGGLRPSFHLSCPGNREFMYVLLPAQHAMCVYPKYEHFSVGGERIGCMILRY